MTGPIDSGIGDPPAKTEMMADVSPKDERRVTDLFKCHDGSDIELHSAIESTRINEPQKLRLVSVTGSLH